MKVGGVLLKQVEKFKYLKVAFTSDEIYGVPFAKAPFCAYLVKFCAYLLNMHEYLVFLCIFN